ncbi:MAG TPA: hypothetical protein VJS69_04605 [Candidatus Krumholzibacteria bacterium]|nr:hypothetical protein [Candidatus Krumholzibacteria bacterium]
MRRSLKAWNCTNGHLTLQHDPVCATCGASVRELNIAPEATLELVTTVHVNPTGQPYRLGIAVTRAGRARTICRVEGAVRALGHDRVLLERRGDMIVAHGRK